MALPHAGVHHSDTAEQIGVRKITPADLIDAIKLGIADFNERPSHLFILGLIYPIAGFLGAAWVFESDMFSLALPIVGGYAIMGPFAAVVLYRVSRRRERGEDFQWRETFTRLETIHSKNIAILGLFLFAIFSVWLFIAQAIYDATLGTMKFNSLGEFLGLVFGTPEGLTLLIAGNGVGFLLAAFVLATNVISFPMALDRDITPMTALKTSWRVTMASPGVIFLWGIMIVGSMILGALALLVGLAIVLPVLGHASWHVYRKTVES